MVVGGSGEEKTVFQSAKSPTIAAMIRKIVTTAVMIGWLFIFSRKSVCTVLARSVSGEEAEVQF